MIGFCNNFFGFFCNYLPIFTFVNKVLLFVLMQSNIGRPPLGFQPLPGTPGGGGIPFENDQTGNEAQELFQSLNLQQGQLPVAVFPPYADGQIFSPRTSLRSTAVIFTESTSNFRYFKSRKWRKHSYQQPAALYGLIARTYFLENKLCSLSSNAYNPCSIFNSFDPNARQGENSFVFNNPICRTTCTQVYHPSNLQIYHPSTKNCKIIILLIIFSIQFPGTDLFCSTFLYS